MRNKIRALALLNTLMILAGCGPDSPAPNPEVLAVVGDLEISASYVYEYQSWLWHVLLASWCIALNAPLLKLMMVDSLPPIQLSTCRAKL